MDRLAGEGYGILCLTYFRGEGARRVFIEAGMAVGYVTAWALRRTRRVGGRLDNEADALIDAGLDRLHGVVAGRLGGHPALVELVEEAEQAGQVTDLTRQQVELALTAAALKDEAFAQALTELVAGLQETERVSGKVIAGPGSAVFTGDAHVSARDGGIAIGQAVQVSIARPEPGPPGPGRSGH